MMRVLIIGNPIAGRGRARERIAALEALLRERGHEVEVHLTRGAGDGGRRASGIDAGRPVTVPDRLVVAGGDGTVNEVVNGLSDPSSVPIALLPMGTANVLAHELGLPRSVAGVAEVVERGRARRLDLGVARGPWGERRFLAVLSSGFDAMVVRELHRNRTGTMGYLKYVVGVLRQVGRYRPPRLRVSVDEVHGLEGAMVVVSKTRNYGGIFRIADRASCDSGVLDVCVLRRGGLAWLAWYGVGALCGGLSGRGGVHYLTGRRVSIDCAAGPVPVEVDGDDLGDTPVSIGIRPGAVSVLCPVR